MIITGALYAENALAVKPAWPAAREGEPLPRRPLPDDAPFLKEPLAPSFAERRQIYLDYASALPTPAERGGVWTDLAKLENGGRAISAEALDAALAFVDAREDTADFTLAGLVRLYYKQRGRGVLTAEQEERLKYSLLNFKYWLDPPNPTFMELWTENHQILSHGSEYLAGQTVPGRNLHQRRKNRARAHAKGARQAAALDRLPRPHRHGGMGFDPLLQHGPGRRCSTWSSLPKIPSPNPATMMVDLLLFDTLVDSFYGQDATSHGRATAGTVRSAAGDSLCTFQALLFGACAHPGRRYGPPMLVTGRKYSLPPVLAAIAQDHPEELLNYERHSIPMTEEAAAQFGLSFQQDGGYRFLVGHGRVHAPQVINLTVDTAETYQLWEYPDFKDLKTLAGSAPAWGCSGRPLHCSNRMPTA